MWKPNPGDAILVQWRGDREKVAIGIYGGETASKIWIENALYCDWKEYIHHKGRVNWIKRLKDGSTHKVPLWIRKDVGPTVYRLPEDVGKSLKSKSRIMLG